MGVMTAGEQIFIKVVEEQYPKEEDILRVIQYVYRMPDTPYGGDRIYPLTPEAICRAFLYVQGYYRKTDGRRVLHMIVSFPEGSCIGPVQETAVRISGTIGRRYQNVWAVHTNTGNLHIHFVINAVSYMDGKKVTVEEVRDCLAGMV
ncbi:MAG: relaxase/mobilization nuclease domain-containing protein [Ruminococcus flavefaciens]|nr:relaxase/mobilization nuclease domain-containing protein [Ruminococcus flavefaciens]